MIPSFSRNIRQRKMLIGATCALSLWCAFGGIEVFASTTTSSTAARTAAKPTLAPATPTLTPSTPTLTPATSITAASTTTTSSTKTTPAANSAPDPKQAETTLQDLGDTLKRTYKAATSLQQECSRAYNSDALDDVMLDPWMVAQPGMNYVSSQPFPGALKPLPARKKWVDHDQSEITSVLKILSEEIDSVKNISSLSPSIKVSVEIMRDNLEQVDSQYAKLTALTNPPTADASGQPAYDKIGIARATQGLKDETSGLNEIRKRLLRQLKEFKSK